MTPAIAVSAIILTSVSATAEAVNSSNPIRSDVVQLDGASSRDASSRDVIQLEPASTNASDLVGEAPDRVTASSPEGRPLSAAILPDAALLLQPSMLDEPTPESTPEADNAPSASTRSQPDRSHLIGDTGGIQSQSAAAGTTFDLDHTSFDQGGVPSTGENYTVEYSSRLDRFSDLNTVATLDRSTASFSESQPISSATLLDATPVAQSSPADQPTPESTPEADNAPPAPSQSLGQRSRLTGDWGGFRSQLEQAGVSLNLEFTQFYQGVVPGTGCQAFGSCDGPGDSVPGSTFEYGGRLDGFVGLDFGKLGLWQGGGFTAHLEYRFGDLAGAVGGTFFPTNAAMEFPANSPNTVVATSLYLSQRIGDRASFLIGKINALDLAENDPFFGGLGIHRFMNTVFAAPPSGLVPTVMFGAIANVRIDPVSLSLWVYDPDDRTQDYWPDDLFANGVTFSLTAAYSTKIAGRPTTFSLNGIYTTKTGVDFSEVSDAFRSGLEPSTRTGSYSISFQFSHLLHQNPSNPRQGWGIFLKGAISDGNPNYIQNSIIAGIGGTGLFSGRELDSFGLGYYYYNLSDSLQESLNDLSRRVSLGDEQGLEVYYSYAFTPWFYLTADLQYIRPPRSTFEDAFIAGLRANIRF